MSNATKVQSYLSRHKIPSLFEGLMAKLVKDMPAEPLGYLTHLIQEKKEKTRRSSPPGGLDSGTDHTSVWSAETREYEKPWKAHSKKPQKSAEGSSKKDWDKTVRLTSKSFDEFSPTTAETKSRKNDLFDAKSKGNTNCLVSEEELLAGESLPHSIRVAEDKSVVKASEVVKHHPKLKGPKADAAKHSQELKTFLAGKRAAAEKADSGVGSAVSDDDEPVGTRVLAESSADLAAEGIKTSPSSSGISQVQRPMPSADPMVQLSICSRCAKVIVKNGDGANSVSGSSTTSASTHYSTKDSKHKRPQSSARTEQWATHRTDSKSSPQRNPTISEPQARSSGARAAMGGASKDRQPAGRGFDNVLSTQRTGYSSFYDADDDEFESVSQISGDKMRVPMWTNSDDEELTPVKGSHMLSSPRFSRPTGTGSSQKKSVTLKEDLLRSLPSAGGNKVEEYIGASSTWSGERPGKIGEISRRSHDSFSAPLKSREQPPVYKSYDALTSKNSAGWRFEADSDDDSAVM